MPIYPHLDQTPRIGDEVLIAQQAIVIGDVEIGARSSIWYGAVVRGDVHYIRIGEGTNIQDNSVIHVTTGVNPTIVGSNVTVGHKVILHGCTIEDGALIGMGAIVMDRAVVGAGALVAAGAIVTENTVIPPRTLAVGIPARPKRELTAEEIATQAKSPPHYVELAAIHAKQHGWHS